VLDEVYTTPDPGASGNQPERTGPAAFRRQIEAVKAGVRIEDVAASYGDFRLAGASRLLGRCVSPDHEDRTPSMAIYTDAQRFRCYGIGCEAHGDVLDLIMLAEPGIELWEAMMALAQRYGIELPERPPSWFARQKRQAPVRDRLEEIKVRHVQRRLFRIFLPTIQSMADGLERAEEAAHVWGDLEEVAVLIVAGRRSA
jgi:DNA primase